MLRAQAQFQVPLVFAGLVVLAVQGIAMYAVMAMLEKRMTGWAHPLGLRRGVSLNRLSPRRRRRG
jgi:NitT/TauT family transport system permease protein